MKLSTELKLPAVGLTGFETPLSEEEAAIQHSVHQFAKNVLRPLGRELDRMTADEVVAPGSPYYTVFAEAAKLGLDSDLLAQLPPDMAIRIESLIGEEMGWGDAGLAISLAAASFPLEMAKAVGNQELVDLLDDHPPGQGQRCPGPRHAA
jgi:alkylation response protein AidB-like acyl-CoA dehydrogenase